MPTTVLIIEDTPEVNQLLATVLSNAGLTPVCANTGHEGLALLKSHNPDLVLLDLGLPDMDGRDICRQIRAFSQVPLIIVSARDDDMEKVIGLEIGADDYVTKPFNKHELLARVRALLRRSEQWGKLPEAPAGAPARLKLHHVTLGLAERRAWVGETEINLTHTEFDLLQLLMENAGIVVTREQLLERIWGIKSLELDTRTVDNHVARLRKKLASADPKESPIETVPSLGYRFRAAQ